MKSSDNHRSDVLTILFAEDDPFLRELVTPRLRADRCRVIEVATGDEALPLLGEGGIDLLLTDISMPGALDGWSLAKQARVIDAEIAVVYVSSGLPDAFKQVSGSLFLRKPCHPDAIVAAIRQLTSRRDDGGQTEV